MRNKCAGAAAGSSFAALLLLLLPTPGACMPPPLEQATKRLAGRQAHKWVVVAVRRVGVLWQRDVDAANKVVAACAQRRRQQEGGVARQGSHVNPLLCIPDLLLTPVPPISHPLHSPSSGKQCWVRGEVRSSVPQGAGGAGAAAAHAASATTSASRCSC